VLDEGCWYDESRADRVVKFFTKILHHIDHTSGRVGPFELLAWQRDELIRPLFGWVRPDGTRRYRRAGIWVPKKNGKSTIAAGLELYMLVMDNEPGAEVYSLANDRQQAGIIFGHAMTMVEASPLLRDRITKRGLVRSTKTIYDFNSGSVFRALSSDAPTKEGLNAHALFVDELHALKQRQLWDAVIYSGSSRRQPLIASISTAGVYDISTIGWEQYRYARDVQTGINDRDWSFFALIYEAGQDDDWKAETTWRKANPSYGLTVKPDALREECVEAQVDPQKESTFRRYRLNQWPQQATRWIPLETWDACTGHDIDRATLRGRTTFVGLDLASVLDLTAAAYLTSCPVDPDCWDVTLRLWVPEDRLHDPKHRNAALYKDFVRLKLLETTPGSATDYDYIEKAVIEDAKHYAIKVVSIDTLFQGQQVANHLDGAGLSVVGVGASPAKQGPPTREFYRLLIEKRLHHGGHPVLRWMADNVEVKADGDGNLKVQKPNNHMDPRKIDGIQAIIMATDPLMRAHAKPEPKYQVLILGRR
jgi:phage terminase large subunit-like protein